MTPCNNSSTLQEVMLQGKCSSDSGTLVITFSKPWLVAKKSECEHMPV